MSKHNSRRLLLVALVLALSGCWLAPATAASNKSNSSTSSQSSAATAGVTQSYNADSSVETGMIVKLKPKDPSTVVPLPNTDIQDMLGVVIPANNATIVLTPQTVQRQQVLVATSGHYNVLVSNQNGPIKVGDYVTISAVAGVGMKANELQDEVLGKAAGSFNGAANVLGSVALKNTLGKTTNVSIGSLPVDLNISHNPLFQKSADYVPSFLAKAAVAIASHPVTASKIYLCLVILAITATVTGSMLYSGVRSGMIAVGRNPLSKKSIIRSLVETVIAGLIIFVAGVFGVYLLLKL
jgi:hypothetical protein